MKDVKIIASPSEISENGHGALQPAYHTSQCQPSLQARLQAFAKSDIETIKALQSLVHLQQISLQRLQIPIFT